MFLSVRQRVEHTTQLPRLTGHGQGIYPWISFRLHISWILRAFSLNFTQLFLSVRRCAEPMTWLHRLKVTLQGNVIMSPKPKVWGTYCFWCGSCQRSFSVYYLLNHLMNFDQACMDTLLVGGNELIRWWPWPHIQGHNDTLKCLKYGFHALSSELFDGFWPNLPRYIVGKSGRVQLILVTFTLIFKVTSALWKVQNRVSVCYLLNQLMDFDQTCIETLLRGGKE